MFAVPFLAGFLLLNTPLRIASALALAGFFTFFGCGGGGSGAPAASSNLVSHTETGLSPNTTYYWKVAADDGSANTETPARSFTTGN